MAPVPFKKLSDHLVFSRSNDEDKMVGQSMVNVKMGAAMDNLQGESGRNTELSERLEAAVSKITGRKFSFRVNPDPTVSLRVDWGIAKNMRLAQLPDGLRSIIGWLVSCAAKLSAQFPEEAHPLDIPVILVIDEPEGYLHPAWQRQVLPAAQLRLPNAQIFAATHSPWIISSVNSGWIHILRADAEGAVTVDDPVPCSEGDSYIDVVEDILGVSERYDPETEEMLKKFRELRDQVKSGKEDLEPELRELARRIANRSESLSNMMGRELWQLERQREVAVAG